jgi:hypothetical protein
MAKPKGIFVNIKETYGEDRVYPARKLPPKEIPPMTHEVPFKPANPSKKGYNKTISKFPAYKEDPLKAVERKKKVEGETDDGAKWRPTYKRKTAPIQSVTTNFRNLKTEFPSIFRRM